MKLIIYLWLFFSLVPFAHAQWNLSDPNGQRLMGWDDTAGTGGSVAWFSVGTGLTISGTTLSSTITAITIDDTPTNGVTANGISSNWAYDHVAAADPHTVYLKESDIDDTPVNGETAAPISSNWAYDHLAAADPHTGYILSSEIGSVVQAYDADLDTVSTAGAAAVSTYFGKNAVGTVGFHSLPTADLGFTVDAPGASGGLLQSNGTKWARVTSLTGLTFGGFTASKMVESDASGNLTSSSFAPSDVALATGDTYTGAHDFGGATSLEIPNGTAPTVDAAGEVAVDTTSDTLRYYGAAERVLPYKQTFSIVVPSVAATDDMLVLKAPYGMTMLSLDCIVSAATSATINIQECDSAGANCSDTATSDLTCDTDGANTTTFSNAVIDSGDWVKLDVASISGTPGTLTVTVTYSVVGD